MVIPMLMIRRSYRIFINMGTPIPGMVLQYGDQSHANDKTVLWPSFHEHGNPHTAL